MGLYGKMFFTVKGRNPACGTVLEWFWAIQPAQPEKQPLLFAQVSQEWLFTCSVTSDQSSLDLILLSQVSQTMFNVLSLPSPPNHHPLTHSFSIRTSFSRILFWRDSHYLDVPDSS